MGFLLDSISNFIGDIQCGLLTLDNDINEKACDKYTGATGTTRNTKETEVPHNNSNAMAGTMTNILKSFSEKNASANNKSTTSTVDDRDTVARAVYDAAMEVLDKNGIASAIASIIANTMASMILDGEKIANITANTITKYGEGRNIPQNMMNVVLLMFETLDKNAVIQQIEKDVPNKLGKKAQKPFTMDFSKYTSSDPAMG